MKRAFFIKEPVRNALKEAGYTVDPIAGEDGRHTLDVPEDWNGLIALPDNTVILAAGEQLVRRKDILATDPDTCSRLRHEVGQMVQTWFSLSDVPGGDELDASQLVEAIVFIYEQLGEYDLAGLYRGMIVRERKHDWGYTDDVLIFTAEQDGIQVDSASFEQVFGRPDDEGEASDEVTDVP